MDAAQKQTTPERPGQIKGEGQPLSSTVITIIEIEVIKALVSIASQTS